MRLKGIAPLAGLVFLLCGCASLVKNKVKVQVPEAHRQAKTASFEDLLDLINRRYAAVESLVVPKFEVEFQGGSAELGYVEKYPHADGYLVAKLPSSVYVNILNPLTHSTIVAMSARGEDFQIWAPRDNKYLVGKTTVRLDEEKPMFNVRPQHLLHGLLVESLPVGDPTSLCFLEQDQDQAYKYYVVGVVHSKATETPLCLTRKLWIERSGLYLARQHYYECGVPVSVIRYGRPIERAGLLISSEVDIERIREHYRMRLKLEPDGADVNRSVKDDRFDIPRPPGAEVVVIEERAAGQ